MRRRRCKYPRRQNTNSGADLPPISLTLLDMSLHSGFHAKFHGRSFIAVLTLLNGRSAPSTVIHTLDSVDEFYRNNVEQKEI